MAKLCQELLGPENMELIDCKEKIIQSGEIVMTSTASLSRNCSPQEELEHRL